MEEYYFPEPFPFIYENHRGVDNIMHSEDAVTHVIERVDYSNGVDVYYKNADFPFNGFPTTKAVYATNIAKRAFMFAMSPFIFFGWKRNKAKLERLAGYALSDYYLKEEYQCKVTREICKLPFGELSKIFGHILQYDDAYRFRFQDIISEIDPWELYRNPTATFVIMLDTIILREHSQGMKDKWSKLYKYGVLVFLLTWWIRDIIKNVDFDNLKYSEADKYWVSLRADYDYMGLSYEERVQSVKNIPEGYSIKHNFVV